MSPARASSRHAASAVALGLVASCSFDTGVDVPPPIAGEGVRITVEDGTPSVAVDPAHVPVVAGCNPGHVLHRAEPDRWACAPTSTSAGVPWSLATGVPAVWQDGDQDSFAALSCDTGQAVRRTATGSWTCAAVTTASAAIPWSRLSGVPAGLAGDQDRDAMATLPCGAGEVAKWRDAQGAWRCEADLTLSSAEVRRSVEGRPLHLADGTTMDRQAVATGPHVTSLPWSAITRKPAGIADGVDDDLVRSTSCAANQILTASSAAGGWACAADRVLTEAEVHARVDDDGYATATGVASLEQSVVAARGNTTSVAARVAASDALLDAVETRVLALTTRLPGYVPILPGTFTMGAPASEPGSEPDERPRHRVTITRPFWLKTTEVTQREWAEIAVAEGWSPVNPAAFLGCGLDCPVEQVNWFSAVAYVNALSRRELLPECYRLTGCNEHDPGSLHYCDEQVDLPYPDLVSCPGFRLPTEAEWEYAVRAGTTTALSSGDDLTGGSCAPIDTGLDAVGWYCGNNAVGYADCADSSAWGGDECAGTRPVAQRAPNAWGLYDVHGNLFEWTHDYEGSYTSTAAVDPIGPASATRHVLRGGAWDGVARYCRSAYRTYGTPYARLNDIGFRVARTIF